MDGKPWMCIQCGHTLGNVVGSELSPASDAECITRGPNLVVKCPECKATKVFYTSDPVVRALYQLIDAIAVALGNRLLSQVSAGTLKMGKDV